MPLLLIASFAIGGQDISTNDRPWTPQLFPRPTGRNGFEEFVRAADLVRAAAPRTADKKLSGKDLLKLRAERASRYRKAIDLVLIGIRKPCHEPRTRFDGSTLFPELSPYKELGRLIVDRAEVQFATGNPTGAAQSLEAGLQFGAIIHRGPNVIELLVGTAIQMQALRSISDHFQEIPPKDLSTLDTMSTDFMSRVPLDCLSAVKFEIRHSDLRIREFIDKQIPSDVLAASPGIYSLQDGIDVWGKLLGTGDIPNSDIQRLQQDLPSSSEAQQRLRQYDLATGRTRFLRDVDAALRKPETKWEKVHAAFKDADVSLMWKLEVGQLEKVFVNQARFRIQFRLLSANVAIEKYRKAHGLLPVSLKLVQQADQFFDPFTGAPFRYEVSNGKYKLSSPGPKGSLTVTLGHSQMKPAKASQPTID